MKCEKRIVLMEGSILPCSPQMLLRCLACSSFAFRVRVKNGINFVINSKTLLAVYHEPFRQLTKQSKRTYLNVVNIDAGGLG